MVCRILMSVRSFGPLCMHVLGFMEDELLNSAAKSLSPGGKNIICLASLPKGWNIALFWVLYCSP